MRELPKQGDIVILHNGNGLYTPVVNCVSYRRCIVKEDTTLEVWEYGNGIPFFPEPTVLIDGDNGKPLRLKLSRFSAPLHTVKNDRPVSW